MQQKNLEADRADGQMHTSLSLGLIVNDALFTNNFDMGALMP